MSKDHLIDECCDCEYCTRLDIMIGDPTLSQWEYEFIKSVAHYGWISDYTDKQKLKIDEIFKRQYNRWTKNHQPLKVEGE